jgi:hypothetical protein
MPDDVPSRRLGRRPPKRAPALRLERFLTGRVPEHPPAADHFARIGDWVLGANDRFGTCGPTSVANHLLLVTTYLGTPHRVSDEAVFDLYRRSGNPRFDPDLDWDDPRQDDNGVDMQSMLEALLEGGIDGRKPLGFATISAGDLDALRVGEALFGGLLWGVDLQKAQRTQTDTGLWDYSASGEWGGHAVMSGRYADPDGTAQDRTGAITWALVVDATDTFLDRQLDEAWAIIWPEHLSDQRFMEGVDMAALAAAYQQLTGRDFPIPSPPTPPAPAPPQQDLLSELAELLKSFIGRIESWLKSHGF